MTQATTHSWPCWRPRPYTSRPSLENIGDQTRNSLFLHGQVVAVRHVSPGVQHRTQRKNDKVDKVQEQHPKCPNPVASLDPLLVDSLQTGERRRHGVGLVYTTRAIAPELTTFVLLCPVAICSFFGPRFRQHANVVLQRTPSFISQERFSTSFLQAYPEQAFLAVPSTKLDETLMGS